jgi:uncharacterized protein
MAASTSDRARMSKENTGDWSLIIFTRWPTLGRTKTRLIPAYGADGATSIHRQLIARTVAVVRALPASVKVVVAIADAPSDVDKTVLFGDLTCMAQRGDDLGERMANAIDDTFLTNPSTKSVVLIGVDCPDYSVILLEHAAAALTTQSIAYAPTEDGGYGLVGVRRSAWNDAVRDAMFHDITWGSSSVMQSSLERLKRIVRSAPAVHADEYPIAMLSTLWDVDTPSDVERAITSSVIQL